MHARVVYVYPGEVVSTVGAAQIKIIGVTQGKEGPMMQVEVTADQFEIDTPDPIREAVEAEAA